MGKVKILPPNISNKIAAGEVVERPASVVKELVENALDAESTDISVEVRVGGKELIRVVDNGLGMSNDDAILSLERHATSKLQSIDDLETISTMGFRGEALPSIASISHLEMITRQSDAMEGTKIKVEGGTIRDVEQTGCPVGTRISVANLFFNVPARRKFLKATSTELNHIIKYVTWAGLIHPEVALKLTHNNRAIIEARKCNSIMDRIHILYGKQFAANIVECAYEYETIKMRAFIGKPEFTRSSREYQLFFLNRRPIRSKLLGAALGKAFETVIPRGRYPVAILFIDIDPSMIDVNVHPAKTEVRFRDERGIYNQIMHGLLRAMRQQEYMPEINPPVTEAPQQNENILPTTANPSDHPRRGKVESSVFEYLNKQERKPTFSYRPPERYSGRTNDFPKKQPQMPQIPEVTQRIDPPATDSAETISLSLMDFGNVRIKARLFNTYIVAETDKEVLFIDQHIAEERVIYKKLREQMEKEGVPSQGLLLPITVELSASQTSVIGSAVEILTEMGFTLEPFGGRTIVVRAVPSVMQKGDIKQVVTDIIDQMTTSPNKQDKLKLQDEILITTACHSSIQAGDEISDAETANLLKELFKTDPPFVCPHGRPIVIRMKRSELEEKFQRK